LLPEKLALKDSAVAISLQNQYAPSLRCFGCGPANEKGLHIQSFPSSDGREVVATFMPEEHHAAFDHMLSGGVCGVLLDCHSNWTAAYHLMQKRGESSPPCTVTAEYHVKLLAPTPMDAPILVRAHVVESTDRKVVVDASITTKDGTQTATCRGTFVAVREGHPAYHRW
jgi:acyl-coenzyme A thioesterase PaaI-like protein